MGAIFSGYDPACAGRPKSTSFDISSSGQSIVVTAIHGETRCKIEANSDWKGCHLAEEIGKRLHIHTDLFTLRYGARPLGTEQRLISLLECERKPEQLPQAVNLQMHVDTTSFPEALGSFSLCDVPLEVADFKQTSYANRSTTGGWTWELKETTIDRFFPIFHGDQSGSRKKRSLVGYSSPVSPVTFDASARAASCIPDTAKYFSWSYPLDKSDIPVDNGGHEQRYENDWFPDDAQVVKNFLSAGGFMYFDEAGEIVGVTTVGQWRDDCDKVGVHFGEKQLWESGWTLALKEDARFQKNTFQQMKNMGATNVCWICPGEKLKGGTHVPDLQWGAFVYLFEDHPWLDCYFPVIPPPELDDAGSRPLLAPFTFVGQEDDTDSLNDRPESDPCSFMLERDAGNQPRGGQRNLVGAAKSRVNN